MPGIDRRALLDKFYGMIARRQPIIGGGGGHRALGQVRGSRRHRPHRDLQLGPLPDGRPGSLAGLLAYGNANEIVKEMAHEVIPVVSHTPVLAGVNGTDPFMVLDRFLGELKSLGFSGVQNFPTVGLIDGVFRANLEETGMGYGLEVDMIRAAHEADLLTTPYVFSEADAVAMAHAGADIIVCHMGLTTSGTIGAQTAKSLETVCRSSTRGRWRPSGCART